MKPSNTLWSRRASAIVYTVAFAASMATSSGCVMRGTYTEVRDERNSLASAKARLEDRVTLLEASNEALGSERVTLLDEMEDFRQTRETLSRNVRKLERREASLSENLQARESELAFRTSELEKLTGTYQGLVAELEDEIASGQIEIEQLREGLRLNLPDDISFLPGSTRLNPTGQEVVRKLALRLKKIPHSISVQGHTDDVPIGPTAAIPSNWELAAARASQVVRLLASEGIEPWRLSVVSFGEFRPVASNDDAQGRARNRRIEIRLEPPEKAAAGSPGP